MITANTAALETLKLNYKNEIEHIIFKNVKSQKDQSFKDAINDCSDQFEEL